MDQHIVINVIIKDNGETSVKLQNDVADITSLINLASYFTHLATAMNETAAQVIFH